MPQGVRASCNPSSRRRPRTLAKAGHRHAAPAVHQALFLWPCATGQAIELRKWCEMIDVSKASIDASAQLLMNFLDRNKNRKMFPIPVQLLIPEKCCEGVSPILT